MAKMTDQELVALVESMRASALGHQNDSLSLQRQQALDYYFGRPFGNEVDGRSQVVERTLMEVVEWVKPQLLRSLCTSDTLAEFAPLGPNDVDQAQQETDYTNHVIMQKNDGFMVLHDAICDILLLKNGYVKRWWEKYSCPSIENYTGLNEDELTQLMTQLDEAHDTVEVLGKTEREEVLDDGVNPPTPIKVYDIQLRVTDNRERLCLRGSPSEEVLISPRCRGDMQDTDFIGHIPPMTRSDLVEMGMNKDFVAKLPAVGQRRVKPEDRARDTLNQNTVDTYAPNNPSQDVVDYLEAYVRVDYDGDGISELRKVILAGGKLPPGKEWNQEAEEVPFSYGVITRMPHRHIGISLADFVEDIQLIRTTLLRQGLDNVYLSNNQRPIVSRKVDLADLALSAPGSPIRVDSDSPDVEGHIQWAQPAAILQQLMPILDYMDDRKEQRTGIGRANTIIDSDVLRDSANDTVTTALNAANQRVEMYLRMISETLIKDLVRGVHGLLCRHQQEPEEVQLRGKWVNVNPRDWKTRSAVNVTVGLGMGSAEEKRKNLMFLAAVQEKANAFGLVSPANGYNLASDLATQSGFRAKDRYFTDPASPEGKALAQQKAQQTPPAVQAAQITGQSKVQVAQLNAQAEHDRMVTEAKVDVTKHANDHQRKAAMDSGTLSLEQQKMVLNFVASIIASEESSKTDAATTSANVRSGEGDARNIMQEAA